MTTWTFWSLKLISRTSTKWKRGLSSHSRPSLPDSKKSYKKRFITWNLSYSALINAKRLSPTDVLIWQRRWSWFSNHRNMIKHRNSGIMTIWNGLRSCSKCRKNRKRRFGSSMQLYSTIWAISDSSKSLNGQHWANLNSRRGMRSLKSRWHKSELKCSNLRITCWKVIYAVSQRWSTK